MKTREQSVPFRLPRPWGVLIVGAVIAATDSELAKSLGILGVTLALLALYFLPAIVAYSNHHRQSDAIIVLNLLLGWTFVGWVVALVWAVYREKEK